ncbi:unnamed protein product [marine sediment metagenome]|uniref:Uncharacterized protein n=1 Tax=marine sediment metagenome TaxID=412755 RepID=X0TRX1_9ZZZZ
MSGNAQYRPAKGYGNKLHFIGPPKSPVWWGKKKEVPRLLTPEFGRIFGIWQRYNIGMGLPEPGTWADNDESIVSAVLQFEQLYRAHFSPERALMDQMGEIARGLSRRR